MDLGLTLDSIIAILLVLLWRWYELKDTGEGDHDLIDMWFGTHVERWAFEVKVTLARVVLFFITANIRI